MVAKIRKGDLVEVITGPEKGKQGQVLEVLVAKQRVLVEGVNYVTKHTKVGQTQRGTKTGGIETVEAPIHISNVGLVNPETGRPARVGIKVEQVTEGGITKTIRTREFKPSRRVAAAKKAPAKKKAATKKDSE